jgi:hypothetical protein
MAGRVALQRQAFGSPPGPLPPAVAEGRDAWHRPHDAPPQTQSANGCLPASRTLMATSRSKTPSSSSVREAPVAANASRGHPLRCYRTPCPP